jgi:hypothetical protein
MQIVPVLAIIVIVAILSQSAVNESQIGSDTRAGLQIAGIVLVVASVLYFARKAFARS